MTFTENVIDSQEEKASLFQVNKKKLLLDLHLKNTLHGWVKSSSPTPLALTHKGLPSFTIEKMFEKQCMFETKTYGKLVLTEQNILSHLV